MSIELVTVTATADIVFSFVICTFYFQIDTPFLLENKTNLFATIIA